MVCPYVRGDIPRAIASGLSYVHVDRHGIINISPPLSAYTWKTTYISIDLAEYEKGTGWYSCIVRKIAGMD